ncbi:MAG: FAD:protein FMN transferase [Pseudomonadota bacterium]
MSEPFKFSRRSFMLMPLAFAACKPGSAVFEITGLTMGTSYNVVAVDPSMHVSEGDVRTAINAALAEVNAQMSNWDSTSEISRFNTQTGLDAVTLSPALAEVMHAAEHVHQASAGRFDTTMGPLIELWGFGASGSMKVPENEAVLAAQARAGHTNTLRLSADQLQKTRGDAQVYLAAIGKGYGADYIGRALETLGVTDYMVEIGGDLYTSGRNPDGTPWQIGIETPEARDSGVFDVVGVSNHGLASSGDYRNYFERDGKRFSHVIDPTTGRPIEHTTASATVIAENAMLADAWATAMLTLGSEQGLAIAEAEGVAVMFVDRDTTTSALEFVAAKSSQFVGLTT